MMRKRESIRGPGMEKLTGGYVEVFFYISNLHSDVKLEFG
jgi:hypothetical protein